MMFDKNWLMPEKNYDVIRKLTEELNISELAADLLAARGYRSASAAKEFLNTSIDNLHSPFLLNDMMKAVERIETAKEKGEKVYIYGDYDVDGVTSVYIMFDYLSSIGISAQYYIPDRAGEGYGLNIAYVQKAVEEGAGLIITVDTGITADSEVEYANSHGLDIVITDHHECRETFPEAYAVINPKRFDSSYPFKDLAGVGVAFKLIAAHAEHINGSADDIVKRYGEFVAMGTIADVMPFIGENRILISYGLKRLEMTENYGVKALLGCINAKSGIVNQQTVSFGIAPRLNAAGRMASASRAIDLFFAETKEDAMVIANDLCLMNSERQGIENEIFTQAVVMIKSDAERYKDIIFLADKNWHHGIIGIVASKLAERYSKPVLLMTYAEGDILQSEKFLRGSGRSVAGLNLVNALSYCADSLIKFGGHELAAGFSVEEEKLVEFEAKIKEYIKINSVKYAAVCYNIDRELKKEDLSMQVVKEMNLLEPFGNSNELPLFLLRNIRVGAVTSVSAENKHQRIAFKKEEATYEAMYFNKRREDCHFAPEDRIDILCNMGINKYMNRESLQLIIKDVRYNTDGLDGIGTEFKLYGKFLENALTYIDKHYVPDKEDFAAVYNFIKENDRSGDVKYPVSVLHYYVKFKERYSGAGYFKFRVTVDVLTKFGILIVKADKYLFREIKINYKSGKVTLEESEILIKLKKLTEDSSL